jgi:uncharacterized protein (DUF1778 family)
MTSFPSIHCLYDRLFLLLWYPMVQTRQRTKAPRRLINIRVSSADRNVIDRAAQVAGKTRSEFMLDASRRAAQETLLDTTLFLVDGPTFKRFKALLDAPPKPNARLQELMRRRAPWDHEPQ